MKRASAAGLAALLLGAGAAMGQQAAGPGLRLTEPMWAVIGKSTPVKLYGQGLAPTQMLFDQPGLAGTVVKSQAYAGKTDSEKQRGNTVVEAEVTAAADVNPGKYGFKLMQDGTAPMDGSLYLDVAPAETADTEPNDDLRKPQVLPAGSCVVTGKLDREGVDVYRMTGRAGEKWRFEVFARRLSAATDFEPILRLRGAHFAPLKVAIDRGNDCAIEYTLPADGSYLIELFDADNRANPQYNYRLEVRRIPSAGS